MSLLEISTSQLYKKATAQCHIKIFINQYMRSQVQIPQTKGMYHFSLEPKVVFCYQSVYYWTTAMNDITTLYSPPLAHPVLLTGLTIALTTNSTPVDGACLSVAVTSVFLSPIFLSLFIKKIMRNGQFLLCLLSVITEPNNQAERWERITANWQRSNL